MKVRIKEMSPPGHVFGLGLFRSLDSDRGHITRQNNTFKQVFARTTLKSQCISVQGIQLWNSLENSIKSANTIFDVPKTL